MWGNSMMCSRDNLVKAVVGNDNTRSRWPRIVTFVLVLLAASLSHAAELDDLLRWVPGDSNALVIVNARALFESPRAQQDDWRRKYSDSYAASPLLLPPEAVRKEMSQRYQMEF